MVKFESKIPRFAEGCTVQVADFKQIEEPICIFVRLRSSIRFQTLMSADIPTRFLILIIGNEAFTNELHEVGRCFGTLMSDDVFRGVAYKATKTGFENIFFYPYHINCCRDKSLNPVIEARAFGWFKRSF